MRGDELQRLLRDTGRYSGAIDGDKPYGYGPLTKAAVLLALRDGPDTPASITDMAAAAVRLDIHTAAIRAFWAVEAAGAGFEAGYPKILPEPHRFSRNTARAYDQSDPTLSYRVWKTRPYPKTQAARYDMLLDWIGLLWVDGKDLDPAFASASYGAPQIMGENFAMCGYGNPISFAIAMARDEITQLNAFMAFVDASGILPALRRVDGSEASWEPVTRVYNGTAHKENGYPRKIAQAYRKYGGK